MNILKKAFEVTVGISLGILAVLLVLTFTWALIYTEFLK